MSPKVYPYPESLVTTGDGGGSDGSMLLQRIERLEKILERLEPKISELLLIGAKKDDVVRVQLEIAELKRRLVGVEGKIAALPSTFTLLTIVFATWALGSGILIFALNLLRR